MGIDPRLRAVLLALLLMCTLGLSGGAAAQEEVSRPEADEQSNTTELLGPEWVVASSGDHNSDGRPVLIAYQPSSVLQTDRKNKRHFAPAPAADLKEDRRRRDAP